MPTLLHRWALNSELLQCWAWRPAPLSSSSPPICEELKDLVEAEAYSPQGFSEHASGPGICIAQWIPSICGNSLTTFLP